MLLVARSTNELVLLRDELSNTYQITIHVLSIDLGKADAATELSNWVLSNNYRLNALINNAGYGLWGTFTNIQLSDQLDMCSLNMDTVVKLCHLLLPSLKEGKQAYLLNIASTAAYQAVPSLAIYSATKAFILSFTFLLLPANTLQKMKIVRQFFISALQVL